MPTTPLKKHQQMSSVGDGISASQATWSFGGTTPINFEKHALRSIPFYESGHELIAQLSDFFVSPQSVCYEIGTSTGKLIHTLAERHANKGRWIGIDVEEAMIAYANTHHLNKNESHRIEYALADACEFVYEPCDLIIAYYTVQFIRPRLRQDLLNALYQSLNWGGALIMFEKVRAPDARFQDIASALYQDFKLNNDYTPEEILGKSNSLRGVLEPFSSTANIDLLKRAGFVDITSIFKYICFEGFLAIK
jgi:tRNA (cmo5U34)-methyltransferase